MHIGRRCAGKDITMGTFSFLTFMQEGGWGMWPVLVLGFMGLASSLRYALRLDGPCLPFAAALWVALLVVVIHAVVTDLAAVFKFLEDPTRAPDAQFARLLVTGLKESTRPAALGGIFLALVPLLIAVGIYRTSSEGRVPR